MNSFRLPNFFLTPSALSDLTLLIFTSMVVSYLLFLIRRARQRGKQPVTMSLLAGTFAGIMGYSGLTFLENTLYPSAGQLALPLQAVFLSSGLVCMVQFAYRFPILYPREEREARRMLWISLLLTSWETGFAIYRYMELAEGRIRYRSDWPMALILLLLAFVLARKVALVDERDIPYWRKFGPQPHPIPRTARNVALTGLLTVLIMGISILRGYGVITSSVAAALISTILLLTLLLFVLIYINALPGQTSFLVKFVAISLAFVLGITGALGHFLTPDFIARYQDPDTVIAGTALHFTPNEEGGYEEGGYTVAQVPLVIGPMGTEALRENHNWVEIDFPFPFFDQTWTEFYVNYDLSVTFGYPVGRVDTLYQYGGYPAIFALYIDTILISPLDDGKDTGSTGGNLFIHRAPDQMTLSWVDVPESAYPEIRHTVQLILYPEGSFKINFIDPGQVAPFDITTPWRSYNMIGVLPGKGNRGLEEIHLASGLPFVGGEGGAAVRYHLRFRQALHTFLLPILKWMLFNAVLLVVSIPLYFRATLVDPLDRILKGIDQFEQGNYAVDIPVRFHDEFGTLAGAFNTMSSELDGLIRDLEGRVAQRTAQLTETSAYLDNILRSATEYAIVTTDRDFRITYFNPLAEEMFGLSEAEALGQSIVQLSSMAMGTERFSAGLRQVEQAGFHEYTMVIDGPDHPRHITSRISGIRDDEGTLVGYARFSRDITQRMTTEARLLSQQRAIAALEERSQIGRELHDRLGQIFGFLSLQSQTAEALIAADKRESGLIALERLGEVAQDAHNQVREFILGMKEGADGPQDFWESLWAYADRLRQLYDIRVTLDLPDRTGRLLPPDKEMHLLRIIQEALKNARRHSGVNQAQVRFCQEGAQMRVTIADQGRGFDLQARTAGPAPTLADLVRSDEDDDLDEFDADLHFGLLGMTERAEALGGTLQIHTAPGTGTQVEVTFAVSQGGADLLAQAGPLKDLRVLLVDDQPIFLEGMVNLLTAHGLLVVGLGHNGVEAQQLARTTRPDVIVMDIHMPVCDGIEATRRIKAEFPDVAIVMLSVSAEDESLFAALKAGASGYLLKDMAAADFFLLITGLLEGIPPLAPELAAKVMAELQSHLQTEASLTDEQGRILGLVAQGRTYVQIGMDLNMSTRTVKRQMKAIMALLHVNSRAEVEAYAQERGM